MTRPPAVILAGGLSRRMGGGDKALAPFRGGTLIGAVIGRIAPQAGPLAINANGDPIRFAGFGLPILPDTLPDHPGPLAGVLAAMDWAGAMGLPVVLTVPCDSPDLPADLALRLAGAGAPAFAQDAEGGDHPVVALWPVAARMELADRLAQGNGRVRDALAALGAKAVRFAGGRAVFRNINHPGDLKQG
jgi:molybdopterin-guanine dinucleotide biosynthesis protein A